MASNVHTASTVDTRTLTTRRPHFDYGDRLSRRHFANDDLLTSHLVAVLSTLIPEGERFVVDAVKRYRSEIDDPALRRQANAFVGQESIHQREHDRFNQVLRRMGYPVKVIEMIGSPFALVARRLSRPTQLALTAAIEHWTAVLSEHVLERRRTEGAFSGAVDADRPATAADEEFLAFLTWHFIEEIEHKSVAFDVMQSLGTTEAQRIAAMRTLVWLIAPLLGAGMLASLATDPAAWDPRNIRRSLEWNRRNSAFGQRGFMDDIRAWDRNGFHPDERDHTELLEHWRSEAFGPGSIVERRSAAVASA